LLHHGARALAQALLNRYLELTGDYEALALLPLFLACRAGIRAHVSVSRAQAKGGDAAALEEARSYLALALDCLSPPPPRLVAIGGLSGTGKTTIARLVAPEIGAAPGAVVLRSDVTRKHLMGVSETTRLPQDAYTPDMNARVFHTMAALAGHILAGGHSAIMDAVYGTDDERMEIEAVAKLANARFDGLWLDADERVLMTRIAARSGDASDATKAVLKNQIANIAAPSEWTRIDASPAPERVAGAVLKYLTQAPER
jgi:hypothetical protein